MLPGTSCANIEYANGPAYVGLGLSDTTSDNRAAILSASYDFGFNKPAAWYSVSRHGGNKGRTIALATTAPVGTGSVLAVYQVFDPNTTRGNLNVSAATGGAERRKAAIGYQYPVSKRTYIRPTIAWGDQKIGTVSSSKAFDIVLRT